MHLLRIFLPCQQCAGTCTCRTGPGWFYWSSAAPRVGCSTPDGRDRLRWGSRLRQSLRGWRSRVRPGCRRQSDGRASPWFHSISSLFCWTFSKFHDIIISWHHNFIYNSLNFIKWHHNFIELPLKFIKWLHYLLENSLKFIKYQQNIYNNSMKRLQSISLVGFHWAANYFIWTSLNIIKWHHIYLLLYYIIYIKILMKKLIFVCLDWSMLAVFYVLF